MSKKEKTSGKSPRSSRYADKQKLISEPRYEDSVASYIQKIKFKKRTFGGVDEADVWRKIKGVSDIYEDLLGWSDGQGEGSTPRSGKRSVQTEKAIRTKRRRLADKKEVASFFFRLAALAAFVYAIAFIVFGFLAMPNNDMSPRISAGDLLFYYRLDKNYNSNDVIIYEKEGTTYVGRIVARPGDSVEITTESGLYINGSLVVENDIFYSTRAYDNDITYPITLTDDQVFVMGDYRDGAKDSRVYGPVEKSEIKGKVISVIRRSSL